MEKRKNICVYCASGSNIRKVFFDAADALGKQLAGRGIGCVCGAGREGLMGRLTDAALAAGGKVTGVIPRFMVDNGWCHKSLSETIVTADMHERKQLMAKISDGAIALPGGCGTMEELLELITWKQLGLYAKPIVILNVDHYYDPLLAMLDAAIGEHFMKESHAGLWHVASSAEEAVELMEQLPFEEPEAESKYNN